MTSSVNCPDCGIEEKTSMPREASSLPLKEGATPVRVNISSLTTYFSEDGEVLEREMKCWNCGHEWTEKKDEKTRQTSIRRVTPGA